MRKRAMDSKKVLDKRVEIGYNELIKNGEWFLALDQFLLEVKMESYNDTIGIIGLVIIICLIMFNGEILVSLMGDLLNMLFAFADSLAVAG